MLAVSVFAVFILLSKCDLGFADDNYSAEKVEEQTLTSELVSLLNGTYFNLNENVCQLQRRVDDIEREAGSDRQCECNETKTDEFKEAVSDELHAFSKILSGFENQLRLLKNDQAELRELLDNDEVASSSTTSTTTPTPQVCDQGWISLADNCYYVSTTTEKTEWSSAITLCSTRRARLAEFQTDGEARYVMENLPSHISHIDLLYTGRKMNNRDEWVFVSNEQPVDETVRTWYDREPDGRGSMRCGCTTLAFDFLMADCYCTGYELFYICERER